MRGEKTSPKTLNVAANHFFLLEQDKMKIAYFQFVTYK